MSSISAVSSVSSALISASNRFDNAGTAVINAANNDGGSDLATAVVDQTTAGQSFQADAAVLKIQNEATKALLDIKV